MCAPVEIMYLWNCNLRMPSTKGERWGTLGDGTNPVYIKVKGRELLGQAPLGIIVIPYSSVLVCHKVVQGGIPTQYMF